MKIYIWDGALTGWSGGLIVVVARNLTEAKDAARKKINPGAIGRASLEQDLKEKPEVVRITETMRPRTWYCHGAD
jgi:hypothetical protein